MHCRGLDFLIKRGTFHEEFYLQFLLDLHWYNGDMIVNGWSCFVCICQRFYFLTKPHETFVVNGHIAFIAKQHLHRHVRLAERFRALALWCIVTYDLQSSRAATLWRHGRDGHHQYTVSLSIFQGRVAMSWEEKLTKRNKNVTKITPIESGCLEFLGKSDSP